MERLKHLQEEHDQTVRALKFPFSLEEMQHLKKRRDAIRAEARTLGENLNISEERWWLS